MSQKIAAADELRKLGRALRNVLDVCDCLDHVGSIENAAQEAEARHQKALADVREAEEQLLNKQAEYAEWEGKVRYAKVEADRIIGAAEQRAQEIKDAALTEGNNLIAAAKQDVQHKVKLRDAVDADILLLNNQRREVEADIEKLNQIRDNLRAEARKIIEG